MKHISFLLSSAFILFLILSTGCEPDPLESKDCGVGQCTYSYADSAKINYITTSSSTSYSVGNGNLRVFAYVFVKEDTLGEINGHKEFLNFEVPLDSDEFSFSDNELSNTTLTFLYQECGRCILRIYSPSSGTISGKRKNNKVFKIEVDILVDLDGEIHEVKLDEKFILDA